MEMSEHLRRWIEETQKYLKFGRRKTIHSSKDFKRMRNYSHTLRFREATFRHSVSIGMYF
jgi:hypothetical protein